jgi:hypothetical protein
MQKRTKILIAIVVALLALVVWREYSSAQGEAAKPATTVGRYQVTSWGSATLADGGMKVASGAYVVDSETGDVYFIANQGAPKLLGTIPKK